MINGFISISGIMGVLKDLVKVEICDFSWITE